MNGWHNETRIATLGGSVKDVSLFCCVPLEKIPGSEWRFLSRVFTMPRYRQDVFVKRKKDTRKKGTT